MKCDTCLDMLRAGLNGAYPVEDWQREYDLHLASAHGIHPTAQVAVPTTQQGLREFWRTFRLPETL